MESIPKSISRLKGVQNVHWFPHVSSSYHGEARAVQIEANVPFSLQILLVDLEILISLIHLPGRQRQLSEVVHIC